MHFEWRMAAFLLNVPINIINFWVFGFVRVQIKGIRISEGPLYSDLLYYTKIWLQLAMLTMTTACYVLKSCFDNLFLLFVVAPENCSHVCSYPF